MLTTKKNELHIINSFNDLMKDTKEKQKIEKMVKEYSYDFFMGKLEGSSDLDMLEELSSNYQKYAFVIARHIFNQIKEENYEIEEYYDGSYDRNGFQITKTRKIFKRDSFGKDFANSLEEELINLVVEDYFKNLNKALEKHNFDIKIQKMKDKQEKDNIAKKQEEIEDIIANEVKETYKYYIEHREDKEDILYNFKYNQEVINSMFARVISNIESELDIKIRKKDIESKINKEIKRFVKFKELEDDDDDEDDKIPMGWKAFAITKIINKLFK